MNNLQTTQLTTLADSISALTTNIQSMVGMVTTMSGELSGVKNDVTTLNDRLDVLENESEVTTREKRQIKKAVTRRVYELLKLPENKREWDVDTKTYAYKYSRIFYGRCYSEVSKLGHLATPYEETARKDFTDAIRDIEAWIPSNGISGLKKEADENAIAKMIATRQGY